MTYQIGSPSSVKSRLTWFDRKGRSAPECDPEEKGIVDLRLSPDNKKAAFAGATAMWVCDLERNTKTRITFDNQLVQQPAWSPDGKTLMFSVPVAKGGNFVDIRTKAADGTGSERTVLSQNNYHYPAWTRDGKHITYLWGEGVTCPPETSPLEM